MGSGVFASLGSAVLLPDSIGVGASGALMGLMGAWLADICVFWGAPAGAGGGLGVAAPGAGAGAGAGAASAAAAGLVLRPSPRAAAAAAADEQAPRMAQFVLCLVNIGVIVSFSFTPLIDWAAHLAGLVGGILLGTVASARRLGGERQARLAVPALVLFSGLAALALFLLFAPAGYVVAPPELLDCACRKPARAGGRPRRH